MKNQFFVFLGRHTISLIALFFCAYDALDQSNPFWARFPCALMFFAVCLMYLGLLFPERIKNILCTIGAYASAASIPLYFILRALLSNQQRILYIPLAVISAVMAATALFQSKSQKKDLS